MTNEGNSLSGFYREADILQYPFFLTVSKEYFIENYIAFNFNKVLTLNLLGSLQRIVVFQNNKYSIGCHHAHLNNIELICNDSERTKYLIDAENKHD